MEAFTKLTSHPVPFMRDNVDTDLIIPKQFLKTVQRQGLGKGLFYDLRHDEEGRPYKLLNDKHNFILDEARYQGSEILITGANFGCGSSREHAPWALLDAGFRVIIAPSFADIFYNNCFKNGILPVTLSDEEVKELASYAERDGNAKLTVDLGAQKIMRGDGKEYSFEIDDFRKKCLLEALDDIALTLQNIAKIDEFEARHKTTHSWLWR